MALNITNHLAIRTYEKKYQIQFYGSGSFSGIAPGYDWDGGTLLSVTPVPFSLGSIYLEFPTYGIKNITATFYDADSPFGIETYSFSFEVIDTIVPIVSVNQITGVYPSRTIPLNIVATPHGTKTITGYAVNTTADIPTSWVPTAPTSYTVPSDGQWKLFIFAQDSYNYYGSTDNSNPYFTVIEADVTAPVITSFTAPASVTDSLSIPITAFTATDNIAVSGYLIQLDPTPPLANDPEWSASKPTSYVVPATGAYTLHAFVKDAAGNVSNAATQIVSVSAVFNSNFNLGLLSILTSDVSISIVADLNVSFGFTTDLVGPQHDLNWLYRPLGTTTLNGPCTWNTVPAMTSATAPRGTVSVSTGTDGFEAFDRVDATAWLATAVTATITYQYGGTEAYPLKSYLIQSINGTNYPSAWNITGSNDGTNWSSPIDSRTGITTGWGTSVGKSYPLVGGAAFADITAYKYYRLSITTFSSGNVTLAGVELYTCVGQIFESAGESTSTFTLIGSTSSSTATTVAWNISNLDTSIQFIDGVIADTIGTSLIANITSINNLSTSVSNVEPSYYELNATLSLIEDVVIATGYDGKNAEFNNTFKLLSSTNLGGYAVLDNTLNLVSLDSFVAVGNNSATLDNILMHFNTFESDVITPIFYNLNNTLTSISTLTSQSVSGAVYDSAYDIGYSFDLSGVVGRVSNLETNLYTFDLEAASYALGEANLTVNFNYLLDLNAYATLVSYTNLSNTWAINTMTKAHSTFNNFDFNSFICEDGKLIGAMQDGIYELIGDKDDIINIDYQLTTKVYDFDSSQQKNVQDVYIHARTQGDDLILNAIADEIKLNEYCLSGNDQQGIRNRRIKTCKGIRGRSWQFDIHNVDGGMIEIESLTVNPTESQRRI